MRGLIVLSTVLLILFLVNSVKSQDIITTNVTGQNKTIFYTNESVYVKSTTNITLNTSIVGIYVVPDSSYWYWLNGTKLTDISIANRNVTTNGSGFLLNTFIWGPPLKIGNYDIVIDMNMDGIFNYSFYSTIDLVYNLTDVGFQVLKEPFPSVNISTGKNTPSNHNWDIDVNGSSNNLMLDANLTVGMNEDVKLTDIFIRASGTGNDKKDINSVILVWDKNENGVQDSDENILGINKFLADDGEMLFNLNNYNLVLRPNASISFLFFYKMNNITENKTTFSFYITYLSAVGVFSGRTAEVNGLPVYSAVKTVLSSKQSDEMPDETVNITGIEMPNITQPETKTNWTENNTIIQPEQISGNWFFNFLKSNWIVAVIVLASFLFSIVIIIILRIKKSKV
jgi:hypothetical protein